VLSKEEVAAFLDAVENQQYRATITGLFVVGFTKGSAQPPSWGTAVRWR